MPISRRHFLQSTGVAASTVGLTEAAAAQEPAKSVSPNDRVQIGCIGFGIMGQGDMRTESSLPGVEIVAVSDVYDGRRTLAQERYGKHVFTTRDYRELLARHDVDAVIIATPDHWHARIATDALRAGKDVYCQKPMVREVPDGHRVIEAQKQTGRILQVGSQRVSSILYAKTKELVRSGAIGQIHLIEAYINRNSSLGAWQGNPPFAPACRQRDRGMSTGPSLLYTSHRSAMTRRLFVRIGSSAFQILGRTAVPSAESWCVPVQRCVRPSYSPNRANLVCS